MPTYEYACPACGIVEVFQSITEKALTRCPQCKKRKVTRMLSGGAGVIFKGSGFWETDYNRSDDYKAKSKSESERAQPKDTSSETKTKTETKTKLAETPSTSTSPATPGKGPAGGSSGKEPPAGSK